jgi:pimeloyl-ACP methyl ester carboxylesterase
VPKSVDGYSQERWREDVRAVIEGLKLDRPHVVGLSMGAMAALHFGMKYCAKGAAAKARSLTLAGAGTGAHPATFDDFQKSARANAEFIRKNGMAKFAATYGHGPTRLQLQRKDPRGFAEYAQQLGEHSAEGSANTMAGYQGRRPSLYKLTEEISKIDVPVLILTGDEDEPCLEASVMLKRAIPQAGLAVLAQSGHGINLEEPALFNQLVEDFFRQVETGRYTKRDKRSTVPSIYGPSGKP